MSDWLEVRRPTEKTKIIFYSIKYWGILRMSFINAVSTEIDDLGNAMPYCKSLNDRQS